MENRDPYESLVSRIQQLAEVNSTETALFHQAAGAKYGLGITDMKALSILIQEGSLTAGNLTRRLNLTTGAITSVVDRLMRKNLVVRDFDPDDRRKVLIRANTELLSRSENVYASMGRAFDELLRTYSLQQLEFLAEFYEQTTELTKNEIAKLAAGAHAY